MNKSPNNSTYKHQPEGVDVTHQQTEFLQAKIDDSVEKDIADDGLVKKELVNQVGLLTRTLHDNLRELGFDKRLEKITAEVPEAHDKLSYITQKTEQAAERVLNAIEETMPIQNNLSTQAINLSEQWDEMLETRQPLPSDAEKFRDLLTQTLAYLDEVPNLTKTTNSHLLDIMTAQDFQDLTGQVIKNLSKTVNDLEVELLQLLVTNTPTSIKTSSEENELKNGPIINPEKSAGTVSNQNQVDDLLISLGF